MDKSLAIEGRDGLDERERLRRYLPQNLVWSDWDADGVREALEDLVPYKQGYLRHSYLSGGGKYLVKCYEAERSAHRRVEPNVECGLLFLANERGVRSMPKIFALGSYAPEPAGGERRRGDANAVIEDYVHGASIRELMGNGTLDSSRGIAFVKDAVLLSLAIAKAIVGLRELNVSHCCLSVDNIIVRDGIIGERPEVVLTSFEHAMPVQPSTLINPVYDVDSVYSASECFFTRIPVNRVSLASDVWSLGAIMTTMLCGSESWSRGVGKPCYGHESLSDDDMEFLERVRSEPIDLAAAIDRRDDEFAIGSQTFETLCRIVAACTEYHPRNRIGAEELVNALRIALMGI